MSIHNLDLGSSHGPAAAQAANFCGSPMGTCADTTMEAEPNFLGWGAITDFCSKGGSNAYCTPERRCSGAACSYTHTSSILAYRWSGTAWTAVRIAPDWRMGATYLYPYGSGWSWMWRPATGWLAIRSQFAVTRSTSTCGACQ